MTSMEKLLYSPMLLSRVENPPVDNAHMVCMIASHGKNRLRSLFKVGHELVRVSLRAI